MWKFFYGKRWIPEGNVTTMTILSNEDIYIATTYGLARIYNFEYTLESKAVEYEK